MACCRISQHKSASQKRGQFWQEIPRKQKKRFFINTSYFSVLIYDNQEEIQWLVIYGAENHGYRNKLEVFWNYA